MNRYKSNYWLIDALQEGAVNAKCIKALWPPCSKQHNPKFDFYPFLFRSPLSHSPCRNKRDSCSLKSHNATMFLLKWLKHLDCQRRGRIFTLSVSSALRLPERPALQPGDLSRSAFRKCSRIFQRCQTQLNIHCEAAYTAQFLRVVCLKINSHSFSCYWAYTLEAHGTEHSCC